MVMMKSKKKNDVRYRTQCTQLQSGSFEKNTIAKLDAFFPVQCACLFAPKALTICMTSMSKCRIEI